ncbi:hypothetical protein KY495_10135 [Massilia sp. PAMC28688]|uniref:hypothetical protein n=1 Tax=Massilia sp. PAMC28688 TaxID=2861283 RepID=UPI001C639364|nr:hypothetical protein [Massilia sp. PAMC28688]QYF95466.1 hypothetical protein KY495_10135 [Massilia sp. PAMC28688]
MATTLLITSAPTTGAPPSGWLTVGESAFAALKAGGHQVTIRGNRAALVPGSGEAMYLIEVHVRDVPDIAATLHRRLRPGERFMLHDSEAAGLAALEQPGLGFQGQESK